VNDLFIDYVKQFDEPCYPPDECSNGGKCWTHSVWEGEAADEIGFWAFIVKLWRQESCWLDPTPYTGDDRRCSMPAHVRVDWGMQLRPNGFGLWASCSGELTIPPG
jgi:hypothetical protein